jgi:hypothetical protein
MGYFLFEEGREELDEFLARTFLEGWKNKQTFFKEFKKDIELGCVEFHGWCAWSCYACWIDGYPSQDNKCMLIADLCKRHKVSIEVFSETDEDAYTEHITCDAEGYLVNVCEDYPMYVCGSCNEDRQISPNEDVPNVEGYGCNSIGKWSKK